eukprot:364498_1
MADQKEQKESFQSDASNPNSFTIYTYQGQYSELASEEDADYNPDDEPPQSDDDDDMDDGDLNRSPSPSQQTPKPTNQPTIPSVPTSLIAPTDIDMNLSNPSPSLLLLQPPTETAIPNATESKQENMDIPRGPNEDINDDKEAEEDDVDTDMLDNNPLPPSTRHFLHSNPIRRQSLFNNDISGITAADMADINAATAAGHTVLSADGSDIENLSLPYPFSLLLERYLREGLLYTNNTQNTYELLTQLTAFKNKYQQDKNKYTITSTINTPNGTRQLSELKWEIWYNSYWPKNTYNVNKNQNNTNDSTEELNSHLLSLEAFRYELYEMNDTINIFYNNINNCKQHFMTTHYHRVQYLIQYGILSFNKIQEYWKRIRNTN